ncbi:NAD-dependent epimerase/dehydratase family protein [Streptomyces chartreusis]
MRIFLTGGSGFVGQHLTRRLRSEGHDVVALAHSAASAQKVATVGAEPVRGDLLDLTGRGDASTPASGNIGTAVGAEIDHGQLAQWSVGPPGFTERSPDGRRGWLRSARTGGASD